MQILTKEENEIGKGKKVKIAPEVSYVVDDRLDDYIKQGLEIQEKIKLLAEKSEFLNPEYYKDRNDNEKDDILDTTRIKKNSLSEKRGEILTLTKKVIAQMYDGVLIKGILTVRRGMLYYFRCRSGPDISGLTDWFDKHKIEVERKLGSDKYNLAVELLQLARPVYRDEDYGYRNSTSNDKEHIFDKPLEILNVDNNGDTNMVTITGFRISAEGVNFDKEGYGDFSDKTRRLLLLKYKPIIESLSKDIIDGMDKKIKEYDKKIAIVRAKGSQYLIMASLNKTDYDDNNDY